MNRKFFIPLILASFCVTGCGPNEDGAKKPVLSVNESADGLTWSLLEGADHYEISVNEGEAQEAESYSFEKIEGDYSVRVRAVYADGNTSDYSDAFAYKTATSELKDLTINNYNITWSSTIANYVEVSRNGEDAKKLDEGAKSYVATTWGVYSLHQGGGWSEAFKTYVLENTQYAFISVPETNGLVIEDGSSEDDLSLMENYTIQKYDNNKWNDSTARMSPIEDGKDIFGRNSIEVQAWRHSAWFKFAKNVQINGSYDTVEIALKGQKGVEKVQVSFEIADDFVIGGQNLKGTYISYDFGLLDTTWKKYNVSLNDPNWKVKYGGVTEVSVADILRDINRLGLKVDSLGQLLPATSSAQVKCFSNADDDWSKMYFYYNGFALKNTGINETVVEKFATLKDKYSITNCSWEAADITFASDKTSAVLSGNIAGAAKTCTFNTVTLTNSKLTLSNSDFALELISEDGGETFVLSSATALTGGDTSIFDGMTLVQYQPANIKTIHDFESFTETGVGYDQSHGKTDISGVRAEFYSDYYAGSGSDEVGGNNWMLMGSTDYLQLDKNKGHNGGKSLQCKASDWNALRMISWGLFTGEAEAYPSATTFSFWAKGGNYEHKLKVRVYTVNQVTPKNVGDNSVCEYKEFIIPASSDWTECTIALNPDKTYYGFAITTEHSSGNMGGSDYYNIDDIMVYGRVNPWAK